MNEALTFYRGWFRRAVLWVVIGAGWVVCVGLALLVVGVLIEPGWSAGKIFSAVLVAGAALRFPLAILALQRWTRNFAKNRLVIDGAGVRGRFGARELELSWPEIAGVSRGRARGVYVLATRGGTIPFSAIDIPAPKRAARAIAERLGARGDL